MALAPPFSAPPHNFERTPFTAAFLSLPRSMESFMAGVFFFEHANITAGDPVK